MLNQKSLIVSNSRRDARLNFCYVFDMPKRKHKPQVETDPFFAQLDAEWKESMKEIDAILASERAELDALFPDLTLSAIIRDTEVLLHDIALPPDPWP